MGWITWKHNRRGCDVKPTYSLVFLPTIEPLYWRILEWDGGAWFLGQVAAWQQTREYIRRIATGQLRKVSHDGP